jgi:hypothetical protein
MNFSRSPWVGLCLVSILFMIFRCNNTATGSGCLWEKDTDSRGLSRHRATCRHYQKASTLATEKRRERARNSIESSRKFTSHRDQLRPQGSSHSNTTVSQFNIARELSCRLMYQTSLEPIRSTNLKYRRCKPIAHCATYAFTEADARPERINPDTQANNAHVGATSVLQDSGFASEEDVAEGYRDIPGMHFPIFFTGY